MQLTELANRYGTDKGTVTGLGHGYSLAYDLLFSNRRAEPLTICEIGLCIGGPEVSSGSADRVTAKIPSISMWHEYFPNAKLYGIDISDFSAFETDWFKFLRADCGDAAQLERAREFGVEFDVILDDGSHAPFHQQLTMLKLFPLLKPGGLYIIEDLQWQPGTYEDKLPKVPRTDAFLSQFIETGRFSNAGEIGLTGWRALEPQIKSIFLIDEDWLYYHRQQFNRRAGLTPEQPTLADLSGGSRLSDLRFWKRLLGRIRSELTSGNGDERRPRIKLALIQKI